jgi:hypothetical protein
MRASIFAAVCKRENDLSIKGIRVGETIVDNIPALVEGQNVAANDRFDAN